ncbi:Robo 3 [Apostichopus japonicus]|uniref:Robo 3 n=1 Tax=Stichopus japonicus TaxID=307972 RepID=A0A2G8LM75_STIJA|nr:Robo 3 [Apostichopus japonicus]
MVHIPHRQLDPSLSSRVKGIVTGYSVFCLSNSTNAGQNKTINDPIVVVTRITQLTPSAWYRVSVAAHTSAGMGPLSAPYVIQMPPSTPIRPPTGDDENGLIIKVVGIVTLIAFIGAVILLVVFCRKRHEKSVVVTKGSLHYEPTSEGIGLTLAPHLHSHQKGAQQPLPPIPTDDAESCHGNISLLTTFSTTNGTLSSTVGRYWPAAHTPLNHDQAGPAYWLLEQQG